MEIRETDGQRIVSRLMEYGKVFEDHVREPVGDVDIEKMLNHAGAKVGRALIDLAVASVTLSKDGAESRVLSEVVSIARTLKSHVLELTFEDVAKRRAIELAILMMRRADICLINEGWVSEPLEGVGGK